MKTVDWYFDFISPYAYFAFRRLDALPAQADIRLRPVLFASLLNHWGQKGPAEIAPKRVWTYRACVWWAQQHGIPFRFPAAHPFNPLPYLRLAIAAGSTKAAVGCIFDALWTTGADPADLRVLADLAQRLGVDTDTITASDTKEALRQVTEEAVQCKVFGVPTLCIDGEAFWGLDGMDFATAYLSDPAILASEAMQRVSTLPTGAARRLA